MSKSSASIIEVNQTGIASDNNGGGFDAAFGGQDWTYGASAQVVTFNGGGVTASTSGVTNIITISGYTVTNNEKGDWINITGGTNFTAGRYQVTASNTGTNQLTLDSNCCTAAASGMTGFLGGPLASPGKAASIAVSSNKVYCKSATYAISVASDNVANGLPNFYAVSATDVLVIGYTTTRGDGAPTKPVWQASGISNTYITKSNTTVYEGIKFDGQSLTGVYGVANFNSATLEKCWLYHLAYGSSSNGNLNVVECLIDSNGIGTSNDLFTGGARFTGCCFVNNGGSGSCMYQCVAYDCIFTGNACVVLKSSSGSRSTFDGNLTTVVQAFNSSSPVVVSDILITNQTGDPFAAGAPRHIVRNVILGSGVTSTGISAYTVEGQSTLTADPYNNRAGGDFSLNNNAGGGKVCRGAGLPGVYPNGTTTSFPDIGAAQHQDSGSGGISAARLTGGL